MSVEILIIRLSAMGDVIHSLPVAAAIKECIGGARITWVTEPLAAPLLINNPAIDEVLIFPGKALLRAFNPFTGDMNKWQDLGQFIGKLRERQFDVAIDLQGLLKSALITYFSGAPLRLGFKGTREFADRFLTYPIDIGNYFDYDRHVVDLNLLLAKQLFQLCGKKLDKPMEAQFPLPEPSSAARTKIATWLQEQSDQAPYMLSSQEKAPDMQPPKAKPRVVLIPGTTWPTKIWHPARWAELAKEIVKSFDAQIILIGGRSDLQTNNFIEENLKTSGGIEALNLTGQTSLIELIALFQETDLVIGADTGPLHLAAATGKPKIVGIYGSTPIKRNGPYGKQGYAIALGLDCQPCFAKTCPLGTIACLKDMSADYVFKQIVALTRRSNDQYI